jgi:hypothetical protein
VVFTGVSVIVGLLLFGTSGLADQLAAAFARDQLGLALM